MAGIAKTRRLFDKIARRLPSALWFAIRDRLFLKPRPDVLIVLNGSVFDADTMRLVLDLLDRVEDLSIVLAAADPSKVKASDGHLLARLPSHRYRIVKDQSNEFYTALLRSFLVVLTSAPDLFFERIFGWRRKRSFIRINHGVLGKADYRLTPSAMSRQTNGFFRRVLPGLNLVGVRIDITAVASKIEAHSCAAAEGSPPRIDQVYGYPRFERIDELVEKNAEPWLSDTAKALLARTEGQFRILLTPTHKDHAFDSSFFPLTGFTKPRLMSFLRNSNIALFLRLHISEEERWQYEGYVDEKNIFLAGRDLASSVIELMPKIDMLITDYSSIFIEYLKFDKPIVFFQDRFDEYKETRGFILEYDQYFPGHKVTDFEKFTQYVEEAKKGIDPWKDQRHFVRQALLPKMSKRFVDSLIEHEKVSHLINARG